MDAFVFPSINLFCDSCVFLVKYLSINDLNLREILTFTFYSFPNPYPFLNLYYNLDRGGGGGGGG